MIGFCEDCGAKNHVQEESVVKGVVSFRCSACGYPNAYPLAVNPEIPRQLSGIIQPCPEIMAAFLFREGTRPVIIRLPDSLAPSDMAPLGLHLTRSLIAVSTLFPDVREQRVCIADKHLTVLRAGEAGFCCLISADPELPPGIMVPIQTLLGGGNG